VTGAEAGLSVAVRFGVLTVSDGVSAGVRDDLSGAAIEAWVVGRGDSLAERGTVADETDAIGRTLSAWCDAGACDVILTTGGTGFTARDRTPEATRSIVEREAPGVAEAIRAQGRAKTPHAALGRGMAGIRGATLIVNLPGSLSGVEDGLAVLEGIVGHAAALLRGHTTHDESYDHRGLDGQSLHTD
jgi:molybdenum cofactor biosynthesis protein B